MPATSLISNIIAGITGKIPRAVLIARKAGADNSGNEEDVMARISEETEDLRDAIIERAELLLSYGFEADVGTSYRSLMESELLKDTNYVAMEVKYNPSSISIAAQGGGPTTRYVGGNLGEASINQQIQNYSAAVLTLYCQLIFDDVNLSDAFMLENTNLTVGNVVSTAASAYENYKSLGASWSAYSVRPQMDGLLALLQHKISRQVIFIWGTMAFRGEMISVDNTYTMFNKSGDPIRGISNIAISQTQYSESDNYYWDKAFDSIFKDKSEASGSNILSTVTNNNILSLSL